MIPYIVSPISAAIPPPSTLITRLDQLSAGREVHARSLNLGSPKSPVPKIVGIDGPKISVSKMPLRRPLRANCSARLTTTNHNQSSLSEMRAGRVSPPAIVLFPTPPFADETATTLSTLDIRLLAGRPRRGIWGGGLREGMP